MKTIRALATVTLAGILFLGAGLIGCKKENPNRTVAEEQIDQKLTEEVKAAFGDSPAFKFPDVQVAAFKGTVQLSGFVQSADQKSAAETIAKGVPGVEKVENGIALKH